MNNVRNIHNSNTVAMFTHNKLLVILTSTLEFRSINLENIFILCFKKYLHIIFLYTYKRFNKKMLKYQIII